MQKHDYPQEFLKFQDELQSFIYRLLLNKEDTEDIIQETYLKVHQNIDSFKGESSFKTWTFSIALNLSRNHLDKQKRWLENAQDYGAMLHQQSHNHFGKFMSVFNSTPDRVYEIKEHIAYCFNCINKTLEINQQICLLLKTVYEFKVAEIMQITKLSEGVVKHAIADAKKIMIRIFDNRCSFVSRKGMCDQCSSLKGILNPNQKAQEEALKIKMVKNGDNLNKEYLFNLRLAIVKNIDPLNAPNSILNTFMLESCETWVKEGKEKKVLKSRPK